MTTLTYGHPRRRGAPLLLLGVLLAGWVSVRAAVWESPFPTGMPEFDMTLAESDAVEVVLDPLASLPALPDVLQTVAFGPSFEGTNQTGGFGRGSWSDRPFPAEYRRVDMPRRSFSSDPGMAGGHFALFAAALADGRVSLGGSASFGRGQTAPGVPRAAPPPPGQGLAYTPPTQPDRWSFDAFSFYRAGSGGEAVSAGRVAIYGASQTGARVQYRFAPNSRRDPRAYLRAYQALIEGGETELAAGLSARPLGSVPVRAFAEVRLTDTPLFGRTVRPAAYVVTEFAPLRLPLDVALELYGGAGYVGGVAATPFADGQAVASREFVRFKALGKQPVRISLGGGAWGGVQSDAGRLDVGPTMRVDFDLGKVPARVSVDWRERVVGDAEPGSGVAATLSTQF